EVDLAADAHRARQLKDRGLGVRLAGDGAIEMDSRRFEPAELRALDAPAVGKIGFEGVERTRNEEGAVVVERKRTFENEASQRRCIEIVVAFESDRGRLARFSRLLDAHMGGRAEDRNGKRALHEKVALQLEL